MEQKKKILVVSYFFFPLNTSASIRVANILKSCRAEKTRVVTVPWSRMEKSHLDSQRTESLSEKVTIVEVPTLDPTFFKLTRQISYSTGNIEEKKRSGLIKRLLRRLYRFMDFIAVPDSKVLWALSFIKYLVLNKESLRSDIVVSTGPPFSTFVIGYILSRFYKVPFVIDYQDLWNSHPDAETGNFFSKRAERFFLKKADLVFFVNEMVEKYTLDYFSIKVRSKILPLGYDKGHVNGFRKDRVKEIGYFGRLYGGRNISSFLAFLNSQTVAEPVELHFAGKDYSDTLVMNRFVIDYGLLTESELVKLAQKMDAFLLIVSPNYTVDITNKLMFYIQFAKPILAIVPKDGAAWTLVNKYRLGITIDSKLDLHVQAVRIADAINDLPKMSGKIEPPGDLLNDRISEQFLDQVQSVS
jgi:hypothetical protein